MARDAGPTASGRDLNELLRSLPSVEELAARLPEVPLSEPSVAVAVSAPHRGEAFAGAREIIDRVKAEAPIWKKEIEGDEGRWVDGRRP